MGRMYYGAHVAGVTYDWKERLGGEGEYLFLAHATDGRAIKDGF